LPLPFMFWLDHVCFRYGGSAYYGAEGLAASILWQGLEIC